MTAHRSVGEAMEVNRVRVSWTNFPGAPGLSTFYLSSGTTDVTALKSFFSGLVARFPIGLTWQVPTSGDIVDVGTGKITGTWTGTGGGNVTGTATAAPYSGSSGAMVRWITNGVVDGHRLAGRTYLVPLAGNSYDNDGSIGSATQTAIQTAATNLITALGSSFVVYHKARNASGDDLGSPGVVSAVSSAIVPDLAVVLRSRRI
jgi:hypothetical protein